MASSVESVISFSIVLAETFAAVGMSTLVPNALIAVAQAVHGAANSTLPVDIKSALPSNLTAVGSAVDVLAKSAGSVKSLDVLVPKTAKITAEFQFQGSSSVVGQVGGGVGMDAVSVKAGYSALYESKSSNKITLEVNFQTVSVDLG